MCSFGSFSKTLSKTREREKPKTRVSRRVKVVLTGRGESGKSSTLRGLKYGAPRPMAADERTVQLDIWSLLLGDAPAGGGAPLCVRRAWARGRQQRPTVRALQRPDPL